MQSAARYSLQVLLIVSGALALSAAGPLRPVDDWFYDTLLAHVAPARVPRVLVIEAQAAQLSAGDALWLRLLRTLRGAGARRIVFTFMPAQVSPAFYEASARTGVVFGRRLLQPPARGAEATLAALPVAAAGGPLRWAVAEPWPGPEAVQRSQWGRFHTDQGSQPALEALAVADAGLVPRPAPYRIDFGAGPLPRLSIARALSGELVPDLLVDTVVVVGPAADEPVFTPVGRMPALQFHAHAIDTLARDAAIEDVPPVLRALVLLGVVVLALACRLRLRPGLAAEVLAPVGLALLLLLLSAGLLAGGGWLPPAGPVVALVFVTLLTAVTRRKRSDRVLAALESDASARLGAQVPARPGTVADAWQEVRVLVTQHLPLQRSLFLALDPATGRLCDALAIDCGFGAIAERRRDVNRLPYRQPAAQRQAVEAPPFLHAGDAEEVQFLVPLGPAGRLQGMWALGVQRAELQRAADFHPTVNALAIEIARRLDLARQRAQPPAGGMPAAAGIHHALALLDHRAETMRKALEHLDTAAAGFDELGRPWFVNAAMKRLLEGLELGAAPAAPALLAEVAGRSPDDVRQLLRRVVVHAQPVRLGAHRLRSGSAYQLTLTPLPPGPDGATLCKLVCELVDVSDAVQRAEADDLLRRRACVNLAGNAAALTTASLRLAEGSPAANDAQQLRRVAELVRNETLKALQALEAVQRPEAGPPASRPVDLGGAMDRVLADLDDALQARRISVARSGHRAAMRVRAEPGELHHVLKTMFELLLADCAQPGEIHVESEQAAGRVRCRFANTGTGMPNKQFLDYLGGAQRGVPPELARLRNASRLVHRWGATLRGASDVGLGTRFELTLQTA
jgi:CHASE2 domain-containing sensor protein